MVKFVRRMSSRSGKRSQMQEAHDQFVVGRYLFMAFIVALTVVIIGVLITLGPLNITVMQAYSALLDRFYPTQFDVDELTSRVVWNIRFPRIMGGLIAGFGLGVCGCVMQAVLKNPLASPFTLGITSGAQFGVSLAAVLGVAVAGGPYLLVGNAFLFSLLCAGFIIGLAAIKGSTSETLILAGIAVNYFFSAMSQLFKYFANDDQLRLMTSWGMGDLAAFSWSKVYLLVGIMVVGIPLLLLKSWDLNIMTSGDDTAKSMGVEAEGVRTYSMIITSLIVATIVCFTGVISFIGLVAPHMARLIIGVDHRFLIPASGILGALVLITADGVAMNVIAPTVIPTGVMTSIIGVPFFMYLMLKGKKKEFWT